MTQNFSTECSEYKQDCLCIADMPTGFYWTSIFTVIGVLLTLTSCWSIFSCRTAAWTFLPLYLCFKQFPSPRMPFSLGPHIQILPTAQKWQQISPLPQEGFPDPSNWRLMLPSLTLPRTIRVTWWKYSESYKLDLSAKYLLKFITFLPL